MAREALNGENTLPPHLMRSLLEQVRWSIDAAHIEFDRTTRTPGHIYLLPRFLPDTNIPIRWSTPLVGVTPSGSAPLEIEWRYSDRSTGTHTGTCNPLAPKGEAANLGITTTQYVTTRDLSRRISRIIEDGNLSRWELCERFRPRAIHLAQVASKRVSIEITGGVDRNGVVDDIEAEVIADEYLIGTSEGRTALWPSLVDRACGDLRDGIGDRQTYIEANASSALETAVRRRVGDPEKGRVIRRIHRELGDNTSIQKIQEEYRKRYPQRSQARKSRVLAALSVNPTCNAASFSHEAIEAVISKGFDMSGSEVI